MSGSRGKAVCFIYVERLDEDSFSFILPSIQHGKLCAGLGDRVMYKPGEVCAFGAGFRLLVPSHNNSCVLLDT